MTRLTDEQIAELWDRYARATNAYEDCGQGFARAVEAAVLAGAGEPVALSINDTAKEFWDWCAAYKKENGREPTRTEAWHAARLVAHPAPAGDATQGDAGALADEAKHLANKAASSAFQAGVCSGANDMAGRSQLAYERDLRLGEHHALIDRLAALSQQPAKEAPAGWICTVDVEKLLCSKLGIEWQPAGMSIESLVGMLSTSPAAAPAAQAEQAPRFWLCDDGLTVSGPNNEDICEIFSRETCPEQEEQR